MEKIDLRPKVLEIIKRKGPVIPRDIVKEIGGDTFIIGAVLSQLRDTNTIMISNTKIGGSPTYYVIGQEHNLQSLDKYLNEKDKRAYDELKNNKILRDTKQSPLVRVSLRNIKDFAKPLEVNLNGEKEIFWKWYLTKNEDAELIIKQMLGISNPKPEQIHKKEEKQKPKLEPESKQNTEKRPEKQQKKELKPVDDTSLLYDKVNKFFSSSKIEVIDEKIIKKKKEYQFIVNVPTSVGKTRYFVYAKDKAKCNEGDISTAYIKAQSKKYPLLFLTTGDFTKSAQNMIDDGAFENFSYKII